MEGAADLEAVARRIVERHVLGPGRRVDSVRVQGTGVIVETDVFPWVVRVAASPDDRLELYDVVPGLHVDPPPVPHGIAVLDSGESFRLNDPDDVRGLWSRGGSWMSPEALAELLAAYQSGDYRGHVIGSRTDPVARRRAEQVASVPGCAPLRVEEPDGRLTLRFCSFSLAPTPQGEDRIAVHRWEVEARRDGAIRWTTRRVADLPAS